MDKKKKLKHLMEKNGIIVLAGVHDALSARIAPGCWISRDSYVRKWSYGISFGTPGSVFGDYDGNDWTSETDCVLCRYSYDE